jgi:hypothetical protein
MPSLWAIETVRGVLAVAFGPVPATGYLDPRTGAPLGSVPGPAPVQALAYDGRLLWQQGDLLYATEPRTGAVVRTRSEPRQDCGGVTALAYARPGQLVAGCGNGSWVRFRTDSGVWQAWGSNGLPMVALAARAQPPSQVYLPAVVR